MATESPQKVSVTLGLDDGTDAQGNTRIVNINFPSLAVASWDGDKVLAIVGALEPCLNKQIASVKKTLTSSLSAA